MIKKSIALSLLIASQLFAMKGEGSSSERPGSPGSPGSPVPVLALLINNAVLKRSGDQLPGAPDRSETPRRAQTPEDVAYIVSFASASGKSHFEDNDFLFNMADQNKRIRMQMVPFYFRSNL